MKHSDFLKYLNGNVAMALDEEIARITIDLKTGRKSSGNLEAFRLIYERWDEALACSPMVTVVIALIMHSYGWQDKAFTRTAIAAAEILKPDLAEGFERSFDKFVTLLSRPPKPLSRKPSFPKNLTQYRLHDVIAFRVDRKWHPAHVNKIMRDGSGSEFVGIEFYDFRLANPVWKTEYSTRRALGSFYKDQKWRRTLYLVSGLTRNPDPAGQAIQIADKIEISPNADKLEDPVAGGAFINLHELPEIIRALYRKDSLKWKQ